MAKIAIVATWLINHEEKSVYSKVFRLDAPTEERDNLSFFYNTIGCDMIDIVYADNFEMVVDDEGLLQSDKVVNEYELPRGTKVQLAGNIVFTKPCDNYGATVWLDEDEDIDLIHEIEDMIRNAELKGVTVGNTVDKVRRGMQ